MRLISWVIQGRDDFPRIYLDGMLSSQSLFRVFENHFLIPQRIFLGCLEGRILDIVSFFALRFANQPFGKDKFFWFLFMNIRHVIRQFACLVINPITVDGYAALFNCTPVDRASDSMMAPT